MRAAIYYRVSSEEQIDGFSLDAQKRILIEFCQAKGWTVAGEYADEGKSARGDNIDKRPAFKSLMEDAEGGAFNAVVVHKIDRFARNIRVTFECLERLARANVGFVAVAQPDLDYTRPEGRLFMGMMATLAQYYSDNLSQETKKGKAERKAQGLYNGHLPFGMMKGADGIPVENPATIGGLLLAFQLAAEGESDRRIAQALNDQGYRTTGVRLGAAAPFTKDTVAKMLQNRFYLGELPGERPADAAPVKHQPVLDPGLFEAAQQERERRATARGVSVAQGMTTYSLSGLATCGHCGGRLQIQPGKPAPRLYCSSRRQGTGCTAKGAKLPELEAQLAAFLGTFIIPIGYRDRLRLFVLEASKKVHVETTVQRGRLERQMERTKDLYRMGDIERTEYMAERERLQRELAALDVEQADENNRLAELADLLADAAKGWAQATQEQRNRMARMIFAEVMVESGAITVVKPHPELAGFFALDADLQAPDTAAGGFDRSEVNPVTSASSIRSVDSRSPGVSVFPQYFRLMPPDDHAPATTPMQQRVKQQRTMVARLPQHRPKIGPTLWPTIAERARSESLRDLAVEYGVSHETIRSIVKRTDRGLLNLAGD